MNTKLPSNKKKTYIQVAHHTKLTRALSFLVTPLLLPTMPHFTYFISWQVYVYFCIFQTFFLLLFHPLIILFFSFFPKRFSCLFFALCRPSSMYALSVSSPRALLLSSNATNITQKRCCFPYRLSIRLVQDVSNCNSSCCTQFIPRFLLRKTKVQGNGGYREMHTEKLMYRSFVALKHTLKHYDVPVSDERL